MAGLVAADDWHGFDPPKSTHFGRLIDEDGWLYRIETDGEGRTFEVRDRYVGRRFFVNGLREKHAKLEARAAKAREKHPDPKASVLELLRKGPKTSRAIGKLIGRRQQTVTDILSAYHGEGIVTWEYVSNRGDNATEHLWSLNEEGT